MTEAFQQEVQSFTTSAERIVPEPEIAGHFSSAPPADVRAALDRGRAAGHLLLWRRDGDDLQGWSSIFPAAIPRENAPWTIVTDPLDEEGLQNELMLLEPFDFEVFLEDVLRRSTDYRDIRWAGGDIYELRASPISGGTTYFITKRLRTTTERRVREALASRDSILEKYPGGNVVLVVPGVLTERASKLGATNGLTVWDRRVLLERTPPELAEAYRAATRRLHKIAARHDPGAELLKALATIPPGKANWATYQKIVSRLASYLFVPPLGVPAIEARNESGADRRDIIMSNTAETGTWSLFRTLYRAEYVVIDAKNHTKGPGKKAILEVAHYLKWYGVGLFAIVACRHGLGQAGRIAVREQWIGSNRMIVPVTDEDFAEMVQLKKKGSSPEDVLVEIIRQFRLSL